MKKTSLWPFIMLPILLVAAGIWGDSRGRVAGEAVPVASRAGARLAALETEVSGFNDRLATLWLANATGQAFDPVIPGEVTALIFRKDTLAWWSGTAVQPEEALSALRENRQLLRTGNGFYRLFHIEKGGSRIVSALRLRSEYPFQNKYLVNSFHPALQIPEGFVMSLEPGRGAAVQGLKGTEFYVEPSASGMIPGAFWPALCYLLGAAALLLLAFKAVKLRTGKTQLAWYLTGALVLILRYGGAYFEIPESVQSLSFFSPANYASSLLFNSLGDLFAFALALVFVTIGLFAGRQKTTSGAVWPWILTAFILGAVVHHLISTLVLNSKISFDIGNVFELNYFTLAGVIIIGMMLFSLVMIILIAAQHSQKKGFVSSALIWTTAAALTALLPVVMPTDGWSDVTWWQMSALLLLLFALTYRMAAKRELMSGAGMVLVIIAACSAYAALTLSERNAIRERNERKLIAAKLENEQDGIAEYLFEDIAGKVQRDQTLQEYFSAPFREQLTSYAADDPVSRRMQQVYFTGYWARYDVDVKCFSRSGLPVNAGGDPTWSLDYFENIIDEDAMPTQSRHLYYVGNNSGRLFYIARFDILPTADSLSEGGTIIVLLNSKTLHDESGFPELLISDKVPQKKDLSAYSIAEYKDGQLVSQTGRYNFLSSDSLYASHPVSSESFIEFDGHSHLIYRKAGGGLLMISIPSPGMVTYITLFSYLFAFFGTVYILVYFSARLVRFRGRIRMNFKNRIEAAVVLIVLTGMLLVGGATVYFIYMNYDSNIREEVTGKLKSVQVAVSELPGLRTADSEVGEELGYSLAGISATLSSNFNIYNTGGRLVYSTQPKIYEQGIVAPLMDRRAMQELMVKGKSYHSRIERTGRLRYLSAYTQLRNANNELIGYLNLPYYARQEDLNKAVSAFMLALINIYVLLFSASLVIAFFIAGRITRPLEVIQQSLSRIRLGSRNEPIRWEHQDEIGALVREYNRMVDELAESANRLARSERESAWREMAKQVAHEIKNPLTPMKLSIQHLQRAQREQHPGLDDMVRRVSETLISQIETLTGIANEFSSFAQMPRGNSERVDLIQIVRTITDLYRESENVTVTFDPGEAPCEVFADRDQLSRVFSNLLKNAVQAIEDGKQGEIFVTVNCSDGQAVVSVTDNGIGIADDRKASLFVPNFTTKTGGTGLGLAMSKNIVEQAGGKIWFESQEGTGTTFHVELPLMR